MLRKFQSTLRQFHEDDRGIESLQVVMIIAIAALVLIAVVTVGNEVMTWMKEKWASLKGSNIQ